MHNKIYIVHASYCTFVGVNKRLSLCNKADESRNRNIISRCYIITLAKVDLYGYMHLLPRCSL